MQDAKGPRVAAIITEYRRDSHADVVVGRLLEGYDYDGARQSPRVQVVAMYTDQVPANDMSRSQAAAYGVTIFPTVREALTLGGDALAVDGVVLIGEHGNYPDNEKGQKLYPRHDLFRQVVDVFRESHRSVPVFCDKHLSYDWDKALWMYEQARDLGFPFMAGSSLPVAWRYPPLELAPGAAVQQAVVVFYGGKEAYGFHALESLQCMVERRAGGETGVAAVQCLTGADVWRWTDASAWARPLLSAALSRCSGRKPGSERENVAEPVLFVLEYGDGLQAAVYLLNGHLQTTGFAAALRGQAEPVSTEIWLQPGRPYSHFSGLVHHIEDLMIDRRAPYPVERTLLTTGVLAALMDSGHRHGERLATPHLAVRYQPRIDSVYNQGAVPPLDEERAPAKPAR